MLHNTDRPTRYSADGLTTSTIDLVITNNVPIAKITVYDDLISDHRRVAEEITESINKITKKDYKNANWPDFKRDINRTLRMTRDVTTT